MQLFSRRNASLALSLAAVGVLAACGDDVVVPVVPPPAVTISITPQAVTLNPGGTATLSVQIAGGNPTPSLASCTSANSGVATATVAGSSCSVTAVAPGSTTITAATADGQAASAAVTVNQLQAALGDLSVSPATAALSIGQNVTLVPNANPAAASVTTAFTYVSSSAGIATVNSTGVVTAVSAGIATITVTATGTGTGFSSATRTFGVTINVSNSPPGLTALTVSPASLGVAVGGTGQLVASLVGPSASGATVSFTSSNTSVVTVAGTGSSATVVGVTPGTATITVTATADATSTLSATTLTQLVPVTVSQRANVTIAQLRQGPISTSVFDSAGFSGLVTSNNSQINQPVDITNVTDQIQVQLTLQPNGQRVDSLVVFVGDGNDQNRRSAARQVFTNGQANASSIELSVNTAEFTIDSTTGTTDVLFENGLRTISASVYTTLADSTALEIQNASNNRQTVNFNNLDGWAIRFRTPTRVAQGGTDSDPSLNWRGGPGMEGQGSFTVYPVFYTPNRMVSTFRTFMGEKANATVNAGLIPICGGPTANTTFTSATDSAPYTTEYAKTLAAGKRISCNTYSHPIADARNLPGVASAVDNFNNPAPTVSIANGWRTAVQNNVMQPVAQRFDYQNPTLEVTRPVTRWANRTQSPYNFATNTVVEEEMFGVGVSGTTQTFAYSGCSVTGVALSSASTADIPECGTDFTNNVYRVLATGADRLGNPVTDSSGTFAIDDTPPAIRYSVSGGSPFPGTDPDMLTYTLPATILTGSNFLTAGPADTDTLFDVEFLDDRSGFANSVDSVAAEHRLARANQLNSTGLCLVSPPPATIGPNFITAPACVWDRVETAAGTLVDGYRFADAILGNTPLALNTVQGYYTYQGRVRDRAGNIATLPVRKILINNSVPLISGLGLPSTITATGPNPFTPNFTELVEAWFTNFRVTYADYQDPDAGVDAPLLFPPQLYDARFNDTIALNGNLTTSTPFTTNTTFYTNLERVDNSGTVLTAPAAAATNTSRPTVAGTRVYNVGGLGSALQDATILDGNVANDAVIWNIKNPNLLTWILGSSISQWNAPATGLKAVVTANSNQINSPFARVDFYEYSATSAAWLYRGSVDGQAPPCVSAGASCGVYIADNGGTRVWTYRLDEFARDSVSPASTGTSLGALGGRNFVAIGTAAGTTTPAGRSLSTSTVDASSIVPGAPSASLTDFTLSLPAAVTRSLSDGAQTFTGTGTYFGGAPVNATFTCTSTDPTVASVVCDPADFGNLSTAQINPIAAGTATITVTATAPSTVGFVGSSVVRTIQYEVIIP